MSGAAKLVLEVSMKQEPTRMINALKDVAYDLVPLPIAILEKLEDIGMCFNGIAGRIVVYDSDDNKDLLEAVHNMTGYTPDMAELTLKHIELFRLSDRQLKLIVICAEHRLYINKLLLPRKPKNDSV